jgi:hypothetical protein
MPAIECELRADGGHPDRLHECRPRELLDQLVRHRLRARDVARQRVRERRPALHIPAARHQLQCVRGIRAGEVRPSGRGLEKCALRL